MCASSEADVYRAFLEAAKNVPIRGCCVTPAGEVFRPEARWANLGMIVCRDEEDSDEIPDHLVGFCLGLTEEGVFEIAFRTHHPREPELTRPDLRAVVEGGLARTEGDPSRAEIYARLTTIIPYDAQDVPVQVLERLGIRVPDVPPALRDFFQDQELTVTVQVCFAQQHAYSRDCPCPSSIRAAFWAHMDAEDSFEDGSWLEEVLIPAPFELSDEKAVELYRYALHEYTRR